MKCQDFQPWTKLSPCLLQAFFFSLTNEVVNIYLYSQCLYYLYPLFCKGVMSYRFSWKQIWDT